MSDRTAIRTRRRLGYSTLVIGIATLLAALTMFFASSVDVHAMLTPEAAALRADASAMKPIVMPDEWIWRGPKPISLESMYGNANPPPQDWIRAHRDD